MYQGMGQFGADTTMTEAQSIAQYAYSLLQSGLQPEAVASLNTASSAAVKQAACSQMSATASADADKTMAGKVSAACASAGVSSGMSTTTWIVLGGIGAIGLYLLLKKK